MAICLIQMLVALVKLTVQLGLQFHMGVILTHCLTTGFWNKERLSSLRLAEIINVVLVIPIKTIWMWVPNVFSFSCLAVSAEEENDGAARWHATTLRLQKKVVNVKFAIWYMKQTMKYAIHVHLPLSVFKKYKVFKGMVTHWSMFSLPYNSGQRDYLPGS